MNNKIPKRIFYVWGATDTKKRDVQVCLQTWRQIMPDYELIEINEDSVEYFDFKKELKDNIWFRAVYERRMWAYVADYVRVKVLYDNGGIYFDTDVSVVRSLDDLLENPAFVGLQSSQHTEPAVLGAQKGNLFLEKVLNFYQDKIWTEPIYTIPRVFEYFFKKDYNLSSFPEKEEQDIIFLPDITIYPERFFIPFRCDEEFYPKCIEKDTRTIHWYGGSWIKPEIINWLKDKHKRTITENMKISFDGTKTVYLFGLVPICLWHTDKKAASIFGIPFLRQKEKGFKKKILLFGFIPLFKIK